MAKRSLSDAVVAVVGAGGGLGGPIARRLAERGAHLILAGPHPERLTALDLTDATVVTADIRDPAAGDAIAKAAIDAHGRLDGVVNAAGVAAFGPLTETGDAVIEELFTINVVGPLWLAKRVVPHLAETKGFLVNLSAVLAEAPMAEMAAYGATKAALTSVDRALTRELRRLPVAVCDVRPPHTETGLVTRPLAGQAPSLPEGLAPEQVAARIIEAIEAGASEVSSESFADPA
ncbi:hypothetical protein BH23ACT2_BH23ACT2_15920 [soil metagenome]